MSEWLSEAKALDNAIYGAIAASDTPALDSAMRRLSRTADHGKLWFGTAASLALLGGPGGRLAARRDSSRSASPRASPISSPSR